MIVPPSTEVTRKPWWVQTAENASNWPAVGWVITIFCSARITPPPTGTSLVGASSLPDDVPEPPPELFDWSGAVSVEPVLSLPQPARATATPSAPRPWKTILRVGRGSWSAIGRVSFG